MDVDILAHILPLDYSLYFIPCFHQQHILILPLADYQFSITKITQQNNYLSIINY